MCKTCARLPRKEVTAWQAQTSLQAFPVKVFPAWPLLSNSTLPGNELLCSHQHASGHGDSGGGSAICKIEV